MKIAETSKLWRKHIHLFTKSSIYFGSVPGIKNHPIQSCFHTNLETGISAKNKDGNSIHLSTGSSCLPPLITASFKSTLKKRQTPLKLSPLVASVVFSKISLSSHEDQGLPEMDRFFQDTSFIDFFRYSPFLSPTNIEGDALRKSLFECNNVKSICDIVNQNANNLNINIAGTAIAQMWNVVLTDEISQDVSVCGIESANQLNSILPVLLKVIESDYQSLDEGSIVNILGQLRSFGINTEHTTFLKLFQHVIDKRQNLSLESIARLSIFLTSPELNYSVKAQFLPIIDKYIEKCSSSEDLHLINYCLLSIKNMTSPLLLKKHVNKMKEMIDLCSLDISQPYNIFNILKFHHYPENTGYSELLETVGKKLASRTSPFSWGELVELKIFCRSSKMNRILQRKLHDESAKSINSVTVPHMKTELYLSLVPKLFNEQKLELEKLLKEVLESPTYLTHLLTVYYALRISGSADTDLINDYWNKSLALVLEEYNNTESLVRREAVLGEVYNRYLYFNHNLGGTYRHFQLESQLVDILNEELSQISGSITSKFSRMAAFVIGYSSPYNISNDLITKLINYRDQLGIEDISQLTQGLQISLSLNSRCRRKSYGSSVVAITHVLLDATKPLYKQTTNLADLVKLFRCALVYEQALGKFAGYSVSSLPTEYSVIAPKFIVRSIVPYEDNKNMGKSSVLNGRSLLANLQNKIGNHMDQLTSKNVNILSINLTNSNICNSKILDSMLQYVADKSDTICGDVVARLLFCCFSIGHKTNLPHSVFEKAADVISDDVQSLHGLVLLQACISLGHYDVLPAPLINFVFNVNFMDQLDAEIKHCAAKGTYPARVRRTLMEFNRSTCIIHPEAGVPWFHMEYCKDRATTARHLEGGFKDEVKDCLTNLLGGDFVNDNIYSPYYHHMDFEFILDDKGVAVSNGKKSSTLPKTKVTGVSPLAGQNRYCVVLISPSNYVSTVKKNGGVYLQLLGWIELKIKQLECLDYTVITVPRHEWQSMSLSSFDSKSKYLQNKIWPKIIDN